MSLQFAKLNCAWSADPNVPNPSIVKNNSDVLLQFRLNYFLYKIFRRDDVGIVRFEKCSRYRLGPENDEGWYRGQCRYSAQAPKWGEFYELIGEDPLRGARDDWESIDSKLADARHFLFYFRDDMFECFAADWQFEPVEENSLLRLRKA